MTHDKLDLLVESGVPAVPPEVSYGTAARCGGLPELKPSSRLSATYVAGTRLCSVQEYGHSRSPSPHGSDGSCSPTETGRRTARSMLSRSKVIQASERVRQGRQLSVSPDTTGSMGATPQLEQYRPKTNSAYLVLTPIQTTECSEIHALPSGEDGLAGNLKSYSKVLQAIPHTNSINDSRYLGEKLDGCKSKSTSFMAPFLPEEIDIIELSSSHECEAFGATARSCEVVSQKMSVYTKAAARAFISLKQRRQFSNNFKVSSPATKENRLLTKR